MTDERPYVRIRRGSPTPEEQAAVIAVMAAALEEAANGRQPVAERSVSAWERNQRVLRTPLMPGPGAWRSFG
ncbi:acyl-CoA carboxylase epsilon subunit-like protein [Diaminobutyricimonas aerilata]|uniref:Acyl-CoA carboxylase epsilon subunit-like protein n=1 Tax=Diaminobutyricimonas aerilata TaxID=1162967 RepID=A0A2M9CH54_9MICO|nr:acyl-CoA carboxylase subunit epsilon [Diaminobutyricimonas aerilata]PJJ71200.1 acyl-CoA carboxylase epsilon subunit-like protein [Diaminobutyricimonas aerilata]